MDFYNNWLQPLGKYIEDAVIFLAQFGMIGAVFMAFLEAIFPSLPLVAIAGVNMKNYGIYGFLLTYVGSVLGTLVVFLFIRKFLTNRFQASKFLANHNLVHKFLNWIETKGFTSVMMIMCLPFFPTSFVNYACAFSVMKKREFLIAVMISKAVSIAFLSYIGSSLIDVINEPIKGFVAIVILICVYFVSKVIEKKVG